MKNLFFSFAKQSDKEVKQFLFYFEVNKIRSGNGTPYTDRRGLADLMKKINRLGQFSSPIALSGLSGLKTICFVMDM